MANENFAYYEEGVRQARADFAASRGLGAMRSLQSSPDLIKMILIQYCARGYRISEAVKSWNRRAADCCAAMGRSQLGEKLRHHARAERLHHLEMITDLKILGSDWNSSHMLRVEPDKLLQMPLSPGAARYCEIREQVVHGPVPFAQVAIEYEIEMLAVQHGPVWMSRCVQCIDIETLAQLKFLNRRHVDTMGSLQGLNVDELRGLIEANAGSVKEFVSAATAALNAYSRFLEDCVACSKEYLARELS